MVTKDRDLTHSLNMQHIYAVGNLSWVESQEHYHKIMGIDHDAEVKKAKAWIELIESDPLYTGCGEPYGA